MDFRTRWHILVVTGALLAPQVSVAGATPEIVARGHSILTEKCARCHAIERQGASPLPIAPPFRDLHKKYPIAAIAEALAEGIVTGHPEMPNTPFVQDDIDAIIGYIESLTP